jgi:hypothetical protein
MNINTTAANIQAAFTVWMKRYEENPEDFYENYLEAESYGEQVTPYFIGLLEETK